MTPTRMRDLLMVAVVAGVLAHLVVRIFYARLPDLPVLAGITLGVLGVAEAIAGTRLRARIRRHEGTEPVDPLVAARALVVAKASSLAGSIMVGAWAGLLAYALPRIGELTAAVGDAAASGVGLLCAAALVGGALWLEYCCRAPGPPDGPGGPDRAGPGEPAP